MKRKLSNKTFWISSMAVLSSFLMIMIVVFFVLGETVFAYSRFYSSGEQACLDASGGRSDFDSVMYACAMAVCRTSKTPEQCMANRGQNGCSTWLGPVGDSTTREIRVTAPSINSSVDLKFYGMCTDHSDQASTIEVVDSGDSIKDFVKQKSLNRSGDWGSNNPSSITTQLDVAKFITSRYVSSSTVNGVTTYSGMVIVGRCHSDEASCGGERAWIYVTIGGEPVPTPEPETDLCKLWYNGYTFSSSTTETSGKTSVIVKARNTEARFGYTGSGAWSHTRSEMVYAKPGDNIEWYSCYYPGVQKTIDTQVSDINGRIINGGTGGWVYATLRNDECMASPTVSYDKLRTGYDRYIGTWQNQFKVGTGITSWGPTGYTIGDSSVQESSGNRNMNGGNKNDVGNTLEQKAETGGPTSVSVSDKTPGNVDVYKYDGPCYTEEYVAAQKLIDPNFKDPMNCSRLACTNSYANSILSASVSGTSANDSAFVTVPYNYNMDAVVDVSAQTVFSGETKIRVNSAKAIVNTKYNSLTLDSYATVVPTVKMSLFMYISNGDTSFLGRTYSEETLSCSVVSSKQGQCSKVDSDKNLGTIETPLSGGGSKRAENIRGEYLPFDASAGDKICFVAAVWPASSGSEDQTNGSGDRLWKFGRPVCNVTVAKKPSFQVWGSGMYSNGGIDSFLEAKQNIYVSYKDNRNVFKIANGTTTYFGSWVDQGLVIGNGLTTTVASGAALGNTNTKIQTGNSGNICSWSPLTFANNDCRLSRVGSSGIGSGVSINREELIDYWLGTNGGTANTSGTVNLSGNVGTEISTATGVRVRYVKSDGDLTISGGSVGASTTYLVKVGGTLTINGNISYNGNYGSLASVPKVVIYAKNNVNINCSVTEVDAVIVTDSGGSVNTCSDAKIDKSDIDEGKRSRQLKIFGTVITDSVELGRTYGNAAWSGSGDNGQKKAAEIFDYDSSILMWSEYMAGAAETDTLQTVYQHELAPRY